MGKECGAWVSRRLWGGGNTSPLRTTAWEATADLAAACSFVCTLSFLGSKSKKKKVLIPCITLLKLCVKYSLLTSFICMLVLI